MTTLKAYSTKSKYKAIPTIIDGIRFHSKKEANYYSTLKLKQQSNLIKFFLMQVPFQLPGNVKYFLDFLVIDTNNQPVYIDVKGFMTKLSKLKIKQVEALYNINIQLV